MNPAAHSPSLEQLLEHDTWLRNLAAELVRDPATADDLVQETWLAAMRAPEVRAPKAWLKRVFGLRLRTHLRRRVIQRDAEALAIDERPGNPPSLIPAPDLTEVLREGLDELPTEVREALVDHYLRGRSSVEMAAETGTPEGTLRWRLKRGRDLLRQSLERRYGEDAERLLPSLIALAGPRQPVAGTATGLTAIPLAWILGAATFCLAALLAGAWHWSRGRTADTTLAAYQLRTEAATPTDGDRLLTIPSAGDEPELPEAVRTAPAESAAAPPADQPAPQPAAQPLGNAPPPATLDVHVYDAATKQSLAGVKAYILAAEGMRLAGTSDSAGLLTAAFEPEDFDGAGYRRLAGTATLRLLADGYVWSTAHSFTPEILAAAEEGKKLEVGLEQGAAILRGVVTDPEGTPLQGAQLRLGRRELPQYSAREGYTTTYMPFVATTDATGHFEFEGVPVLPLRLRVRAEGHYELVHELTADAAAPTELTLPLSPEARCTGTVRDRLGSPVAGARVWHDPFDGEPPLSNQGDPYYSIPLYGFTTEVVTDEHGQFVLDRLREGPLRVWAQDPDQPAWVQSRTFQVELGQDFTWDPILEERAPLQVRVYDHLGEPASGVAVRLLSASSVEARWHRALEVPADGLVQLHDWVDVPLEIIVQPTVWGGSAPLEFRKGLCSADSPIVVHLPDATPAVLRGTVRDGQGDTPPETFITLANPKMEFVAHGRVNQFDGSYTVTLPPGRYLVSIDVEGRGFAAFGERILQPGETTDWNPILPETVPLRLVERNGPPLPQSSYRIQAVEGWRTELQRVSVIEDGQGQPSSDLSVLPGQYVHLYAHSGQVISRTMFAVTAEHGGYLDPNGDQPALTAVAVSLDGAPSPPGTRIRVAPSGGVTGDAPTGGVLHGEEARVAEGLFLLPLGLGAVDLEAQFPDGRTRSLRVDLVRRGSGELLVIDG